MKKPGQVLFLMLFMLAGASYSGAADLAGLVEETQKHANRTLGSTQLHDGPHKSTPQHAGKSGPKDSTLLKATQKPNQKDKKQPGLFNRCTQYVHDTTSSMQEYYDRLDPTYQTAAKVIAAVALAGAAYALYARSDNVTPNIINNQNEDIQQCSFDDLKKADSLFGTKEFVTGYIKTIESEISQGKRDPEIFEDLQTEQALLDKIVQEISIMPKICLDNYEVLGAFTLPANTVVNAILYPTIGGTEYFQEFLQNPKELEECIEAIAKFPLLIKEPLALVDEKLRLSIFIQHMEDWRLLGRPIQQEQYSTLSPGTQALHAKLRALVQTPQFQRLFEASEQLKFMIINSKQP